MFDKAISYTNIIIVAGFAGLLTIWGYIQNFLHDWDKMASILAIMVALWFFRIWMFFTLPLTILPGLIGSAILIICFVKYLFNCY